jgi:Transposase DDE domain
VAGLSPVPLPRFGYGRRGVAGEGARTQHQTVPVRDEHGQAAYRKCKWPAEPPNGWIKNMLRLRQFSMRGLHRVRAEWKLVCIALNLRRMATMTG